MDEDEQQIETLKKLREKFSRKQQSLDISEEFPQGRATFINFKTKVIEELVENQFYDSDSNEDTVIEKGEESELKVQSLAHNENNVDETIFDVTQ